MSEDVQGQDGDPQFLTAAVPESAGAVETGSATRDGLVAHIVSQIPKALLPISLARARAADHGQAVGPLLLFGVPQYRCQASAFPAPRYGSLDTVCGGCGTTLTSMYTWRIRKTNSLWVAMPTVSMSRTLARSWRRYTRPLRRARRTPGPAEFAVVQDLVGRHAAGDQQSRAARDPESALCPRHPRPPVHPGSSQGQ